MNKQNERKLSNILERLKDNKKEEDKILSELVNLIFLVDKDFEINEVKDKE